MLGKFILFCVVLLALAACGTGAVDDAATISGEPAPPPATPPAPSPAVQPLAPIEATTGAPTIVPAPAPELGPDAPPGSPPALASVANPASYTGTFRGTAPDGRSIQVEILDAGATGARINHLLAPSGPLLPGQAVWRDGTLTDEMPEGVFRYTPIGPDQLRYEGPGPSGGIVTVTLTRV